MLPVYVGPGVRLIDYNNGRDSSAFALGVRGVAGMLFDFKDVPLDVFFEIAPVLEYKFSSGAGFQLSLNVGAGIHRRRQATEVRRRSLLMEKPPKLSRPQS